MTQDLYERISDPAQPPVIIAEAGINHNGNMESARELVHAAAESGADVIKFQTHLPEHEMLQDGFTADYVGESLFDLLSRMELSKPQHVELMALAEQAGIHFLSTPFSKEAADLLDEIGVSCFKIGSGEATNLPLVTYIARKGKPVIISTGMTSLEEIREIVAAVRNENPRIAIMHCTSTYPTAYKDVRLKTLDVFAKEFPGIPIGLSDHSQGVFTALGAVALGARIIEKHFTGSRQWEGPDQQVSIEPAELKELTQGARAIHAGLQGSGKDVLSDEVPVQKMARESIVTIADINPGDVFSEQNIWVKRPGTGIPARKFYEITGKVAKNSIKKNSLLTFEDIQ
jgi:Sialic acid synthase